MSLTAGTKVRILSVETFNENFVKVGDIAEIVYIGGKELRLVSAGWNYPQFTYLSLKGTDFEVIEEEQ